MRAESGVTLIELVIAVTIFALMSGAIASTVTRGLSLARNNRHRSVAANLASQEMDIVRATTFTSLPLGLVTSTQGVDGVDYSVARESEWVPTGATSGACDSVGGTPNVLRVRVLVTWSAMQGTKPVESNSVLTPPVGAYDPNTGHIGVKVLDRDAEPEVGQPVTVTGPGVNRVLTTTSEGCAFFDHLAANTYTVSMASANHVDRQGNPAPSQSVGVTVGTITSVGFDYDASATLQLTLASLGGGIAPTTVPITVHNAQLLPTGLRTVAGTGLTRTITDLFPFLDGYEVWAGDCADADPEGVLPDQSGPYWPDAQRDPAFETQAGTSVSATVNLPSVDVTVTEATLLPVVGSTVTADHTADLGCAAGSTLTLGVTDALGMVHAALPLGTWSIQVTGKTPLTSWPSQVMDPAVTTMPSVQVVVN